MSSRGSFQSQWWCDSVNTWQRSSGLKKKEGNKTRKWYNASEECKSNLCEKLQAGEESPVVPFVQHLFSVRILKKMSIADVGIREILQYLSLVVNYVIMCDTHIACNLPDTDLFFFFSEQATLLNIKNNSFKICNQRTSLPKIPLSIAGKFLPWLCIFCWNFTT